MEIIKDYLFWIIFFTVLIVIAVIRLITSRPNFMRSMYEKTIEIAALEDVNSILLEIMERSGFKDVGFDSEGKRFYATTSFSMSSWFEHIEIKIIPIDNKLQLHFSSICGYPYQIYDWGKNKENFNRFHYELMQVI